MPRRLPLPALLLVALGLLLTACGFEVTSAEASGQGPAVTEDARQAPTPPSATIRTAAGSPTTMANGSSCWGRACIDMVGPEQRDDIPEVTVTRGSTITFALAFDPDEVTLSFPEDNRTIALDSERSPRWEVDQGGLAVVTAVDHGTGGGDVGYVVRLTLDR